MCVMAGAGSVTNSMPHRATISTYGFSKFFFQKDTSQNNLISIDNDQTENTTETTHQYPGGKDANNKETILIVTTTYNNGNQSPKASCGVIFLMLHACVNTGWVAKRDGHCQWR